MSLHSERANGDWSTGHDGHANDTPPAFKVVRCPGAKSVIDDPSGKEEQTFKRLMRNQPAVGDLIDVNGEQAIVTSVSLIPPRRNVHETLAVLVHCRAHAAAVRLP